MTEPKPSVSLSPLPANEDDPLERSLGVSLVAFPLLRAALEQHGAALRIELLEFAHALHYNRAPRWKRNLLARITVNDSGVPEVAVVRDLSESGVRLWVEGEQGFDATRVEPYPVEIRVPGSRAYVCTLARLVRVHVTDRGRGAELAFSFTEETDQEGLRHLLEKVKESTPRVTDRPSQA